jgi:cobalt-zinc-cadmium efflux system outer membrane protein
VESAEKSTTITKNMVDAGQMTALDLGLIELEAGRLKIETLSAEALEVNARGDLSRIVGVHAEAFKNLPNDALPKLPETPLSPEELRKIMLANHPELARLRAQYEITERQLHLELSKQYPDFKIGPTYDHERGERKTNLGLTLGIDLPVFDRNQQAIASAKQKREEVRVKYEAAANRALAALDQAYANTHLAGERLKLLNTLLVPRANANIELSRKAVETGVSDFLKFLEAQRSQRAVLVETVDTELSLRSAWVELEQAVGYPLLHFANESPAEVAP